jgi:uncharacterized repeat protein (TIGR01451 family)
VTHPRAMFSNSAQKYRIPSVGTTCARGFGASALCIGFLACFVSPSHAVTPAGTQITNQATLTYSYGAGPLVSQQTNAVSFQVAQLLDVNVQTGEAGPVIAGSPDLRRAMSFLVANTGNGPDTIRLRRVDALGADQFDPRPSAVAIYIENGLAPGLQTSGPNADIGYVAGSNDLNLAAGEVRRVYLASDIDPNLANGAQGRSQLLAESTLAGAVLAQPGQALAATRLLGVPVVVGASRAQSQAIWPYQISGLMLRVDKEVIRVRDAQGGSTLVPGSVMSYRIRIFVQGTGIATNVEFNDPLPPQTSYVPGSMKVAGAARTDAADADGAEFDGTQITARLGNLSAPTQVDIEFDATVQ